MSQLNLLPQIDVSVIFNSFYASKTLQEKVYIIICNLPKDILTLYISKTLTLLLNELKRQMIILNFSVILFGKNNY